MAVAAIAPIPEPPAAPTPEDGCATAPWFEAVFRGHYAAVVRWSRALGAGAGAEDIAQDVFLTAHRRREQLGDPSGIRPWLFGITRRLCANARRGQARHEARRVHAEPPAPFPAVEQATERIEAAGVMQAFLDRLPEPQRLVFILVEIEGLDVPEVARMLELPPGRVHARLRIARERLARFVQQRHNAMRGER